MRGSQLALVALLAARVHGFPVSLPSAPALTAPGDDTAGLRTVSAALCEHLRAGRFRELDEALARMRRERPRTNAGRLMLPSVYSALGKPEGEPDTPVRLPRRPMRPSAYSAVGMAIDEGALSWVPHIEKLRAFARDRRSAAAWSALGQGLIAWAFKGRTAKWAEDVTDEEWKLFEERLDEALASLRLAQKADPDAWESYLFFPKILGATGVDKATVRAIAKLGLAREPDAVAIHHQVTWALLPRWGGAEGAWQAYVAEAAGTDDALYAEIAEVAANLEALQKETLFGPGKLSWPRIRAGMRALEARYPTSLTVASRRVWWAHHAGDKAEAQLALRRVGNACELAVWETPENFRHVRVWALGPDSVPPETPGTPQPPPANPFGP